MWVVRANVAGLGLPKTGILSLGAVAWPLPLTNRTNQTPLPMNNPLRGLLAGAAAYKWGGGCFGTVILFLIVYWLLGSC